MEVDEPRWNPYIRGTQFEQRCSDAGPHLMGKASYARLSIVYNPLGATGGAGQRQE